VIHKRIQHYYDPNYGCLEKEESQWSGTATKTFKEIKQRMTKVPVMRLPDFSKALEVMCDASGIDIGGVLSQERHLIAFFSEKLSGAKLNYSKNDRILCSCAIITSLATLPFTVEICSLLGPRNLTVP